MPIPPPAPRPTNAHRYILLDIYEVFRSTHLMVGGGFDVWLNKTRRDTEINFEAMRFTIPLNASLPVAAAGILGRDVTKECGGSDCDLIRLPRINPKFQGKNYCYAYGMQTKWKGGPFASQVP